MNAQRDALAALKQRLLPHGQDGARAAFFSTGVPELDGPLGGGLPLGALHEVYARAPADSAAASGFALALAIRGAGKKPLLWVRQDFADGEAGRLHAPGLVELGRDPASLVLVRARDASGVLRAGLEALRCGALGAVGLDLWGEPGLLDLTASRRFALAAAASGVPAIMVRIAAKPQPSAALTRWSVAAAPSRPLLANAPGAPSFSIRLLRHRAGLEARDWHVEWDRDRCSFREGSPRPEGSTLSRPVVPLPAHRPFAAGQTGDLRRAG